MSYDQIFNKKCLEQLAWRGYMEYQRTVDFAGPVPSFDDLPEKEKEGWQNATDRILELALWEVKNKLSL